MLGHELFTISVVEIFINETAKTGDTLWDDKKTDKIIRQQLTTYMTHAEQKVELRERVCIETGGRIKNPAKTH